MPKITAEQIKQVQEIKEGLKQILIILKGKGVWSTPCPEGISQCLNDCALCWVNVILLNTPLKDVCLKGEVLSHDKLREYSELGIAQAQHDADSVTIGQIFEEVKSFQR